MGRIDFSAINAAALQCFDSLLREWLPDGHKDGPEYKSLNPTRADSRAGSFSINVVKGVWQDFATDDKGSDPVSLYAYLFHGNDQGAAAKELGDRLGVRSPGTTAPARSASTPGANDSASTAVAARRSVKLAASTTAVAPARRARSWRACSSVSAACASVERAARTSTGSSVPWVVCAWATGPMKALATLASRPAGASESVRLGGLIQSPSRQIFQKMGAPRGAWPWAAWGGQPAGQGAPKAGGLGDLGARLRVGGG